MGPSIRVLLADDHPLMLDGLHAFLEPHVDVTGRVTDGCALVEAALRLKPDLVIADITMPQMNGIDAATQILRELPKTKMIFFTMHVSIAYAEAALDAGATGYVVKRAAQEELLEAIQQVMDGRVYISPHISNEITDRFKNPSDAADTLLRLTIREREVLRLIAEGRRAKEIASLLTLSVKTVSFHRENLKRKLGISTTAALTRYAVDLGVLSIPQRNPMAT